MLFSDFKLGVVLLTVDSLVPYIAVFELTAHMKAAFRQHTTG
jgi:hypothetical protein